MNNCRMSSVAPTVFGLSLSVAGCMFSLEDPVAEPLDGSDAGVDASAPGPDAVADAPAPGPDAVADAPSEVGCEPGQMRSCYSGNVFEVGLGVCQAGTSTCDMIGWGPCEGEVTPSIEACNELDDDCDGITDEGCECVSGTIRPCYSGPSATQDLGICRAGVQTCTAGNWASDCDGEVLPGNEDCHGEEDRDCDGKIRCEDADCADASCSDDGRICRDATCLWEGENCSPCPWGYEPQGGACNGKFACILQSGLLGQYFHEGQWHDGCAICNMGGGVLWRIR